MAFYIPDANILINAHRKDATNHEVCRNWLLERAAAGDQIGMAELVEVALLRISTHPKLLLVPTEDVLLFWKEDLWSYRGLFRISAGTQHANLMADLIRKYDLIGNDMNDAWLAALALEYDAFLVSLDRGFSRFKNLPWLDPANA